MNERDKRLEELVLRTTSAMVPAAEKVLSELAKVQTEEMVQLMAQSLASVVVGAWLAKEWGADMTADLLVPPEEVERPRTVIPCPACGQPAGFQDELVDGEELVCSPCGAELVARGGLLVVHSGGLH